MATAGNSRICRATVLTIITCLFSFPAYAKYSGGTGEPDDPYQIATAEDLILLGETPEDYDKHFILTADIDLDPNLPGRKVFDKAVIAPGTYKAGFSPFQGTPFTGVFDGNGHTVSYLTIQGKDYLGLFGCLGYGAEVKNLGLVDVDIRGSGEYVGGLVANNRGVVTACYSTGAVMGQNCVGGLIGVGSATQCYSTCSVRGHRYAGGLVVGGSATQCYSTGAVSGYEGIGGLVADGYPPHITHSVWDVEKSGLSESAGGVGLTTAEMMDPYMLGLNGFANDPNWILDPGRDYPRLAWQGTPGSVIPEPIIDWLQGQGTPEDPYQIHNAEQLIFLRKASIMWDKYFVLCADIDLDPNLPGRSVFGQAVIPIFTGVLDGNGHIISNLTITGDSYLGLFGLLDSTASVFNLGLEAVDIVGTGHDVGGLVGENGGSVRGCYSSGSVIGNSEVGEVGGLVGENNGEITKCCSTSVVSGDWYVGGLVGLNKSSVFHCYSTGAVTGNAEIGGLVGNNYIGGIINFSYSTGSVSGESFVGGLVGTDRIPYAVKPGQRRGVVNQSFWDIEASGLATSVGGTGKTMAEMQTASTFLEAGWDFVGETENGTEDIWKIAEGLGYPHLAWEKYSGGTGDPNDPYQIATAADLIALGETPEDYDKHFILTADIDLDPNLTGRKVFDRALIAPDTVSDENDQFQGTPFTGVFNGDGHTISHLMITGRDFVGLFGRLESEAEVRDLRVNDVIITRSGYAVGGLVGYNYSGTVIRCCSTGTITGDYYVGGLVGGNVGTVTQCYNISVVSGNYAVGGLVGDNLRGTVTHSYSTGEASGNSDVGGLAGYNYFGFMTHCYSTTAVSGNGENIGGLVGGGWGDNMTGCFWDTQTSYQTTSIGGTGKTTAEMQTAGTFLDAGWDFVDETDNGTEDIWWIDEGQDYPKLWWETID